MKLKVVLALVVALFVTGCASTHAPMGNMVNLENTDFSKPMKEGKACAKYILFFGPFGQESIVEAAKSAQIKKVEAAEYRVESGFLVTNRCAVVYGN